MSMELLISLSIGVMVSCGIYLLLRPNTFSVVLGLTFLSYAVNVFLFAMGRLHLGVPPILAETKQYTDPLPQALVLTAIVISFGMTAFLIVLALRARDTLGTDHINGKVVSTPEAVTTEIPLESATTDKSIKVSDSLSEAKP